MNWTYFLVLLATLFFPIVLSFEKKVHYYSSWKHSLLSATIIAIPFLVWDAIFTDWKFWGFNDDYISGIKIHNLPIEEILFFIIIPFACTFIYQVVKYYFRNYNLDWFNRIIFLAVPIFSVFISIFYSPGYYTLSVTISSSIILAWLIINKRHNKIPLSFIICFVPFIIMNGILTGAVTEEPVVWYNEAQIVSKRIITIPVEDILYNFTLLVSNMLLFEVLRKRSS